MEDETGRVRLIGTIRVDELVTGVVVALLGVGTEDGDFQVEEYTFSGFAPQTSLSTSDPSSIKQNRFIAFMSGISIGKAESNKLALMLAFDYLGGHIGSKEVSFQIQIQIEFDCLIEFCFNLYKSGITIHFKY